MFPFLAPYLHSPITWSLLPIPSLPNCVSFAQPGPCPLTLPQYCAIPRFKHSCRSSSVVPVDPLLLSHILWIWIVFNISSFFVIFRLIRLDLTIMDSHSESANVSKINNSKYNFPNNHRFQSRDIIFKCIAELRADANAEFNEQVIVFHIAILSHRTEKREIMGKRETPGQAILHLCVSSLLHLLRKWANSSS